MLEQTRAGYLHRIVMFVLAFFTLLYFYVTFTPANQARSRHLEPAEPRSTSTGAAETCHRLEETLGASTVQTIASGSGYSVGANAAWNVFNTEINFQPACIVFARKAADVQIAMQAIFEDDVDYAVQAGGHSAMKGWNNVQDGVLISFLYMDGTFYDSVKDTITLFPGIRWGEAISALEPFGVAPVGGRINDVGTGLMLGGGLSFLSPAFGFAADTFVSLDVVFVNGTLVTATVDNEYADLFRALKGGANRFGIVTRYEVQAAHTGRAENKVWWGGQILYPNSSAEAVLHAVAHHAQDANDTNAAALVFFGGIIGNDTSISPIIDASLFYNGSSKLFNQTFWEFLAIPSTEAALGPLSYVDISNMLAESANASGHGQLFGASVLVGMPSSQNFSTNDIAVDDVHDSEDPYLKTFRLFNNFTAAAAPSNDLDNTILAFTPVLDAQIRKGLQRGGNAIDPPLEYGGYNAVQFQVTFRQGVKSVSREIERGRERFLSDVPSTPGFPLYVNECDAKQHVFETYGDYEFLKAIYAKYDPTRFNIRHTQGPIGL